MMFHFCQTPQKKFNLPSIELSFSLGFFLNHKSLLYTLKFSDPRSVISRGAKCLDPKKHYASCLHGEGQGMEWYFTLCNVKPALFLALGKKALKLQGALEGLEASIFQILTQHHGIQVSLILPLLWTLRQVVPGKLCLWNEETDLSVLVKLRESRGAAVKVLSKPLSRNALQVNPSRHTSATTRYLVPDA